MKLEYENNFFYWNMKVLCIDNTNVGLSISVGKWYEVLEIGNTKITYNTYTIISDKGVRARLSKNFFITLEELREQKLNELL